MAAKTEVKLNLELMCPKCGGSGNDPADGCVNLDLNHMNGALTCGECNDEFTILEAIEVFSVQFRRWQMVERMVNFAVKQMEIANQGECALVNRDSARAFRRKEVAPRVVVHPGAE